MAGCKEGKFFMEWNGSMFREINYCKVAILFSDKATFFPLSRQSAPSWQVGAALRTP